jgi:glucose-6-phosphate dehydrogenase assembly protein OpcA
MTTTLTLDTPEAREAHGLIDSRFVSTSRKETTSEMLVLGTSTWWQKYFFRGGSK